MARQADGGQSTIRSAARVASLSGLYQKTSLVEDAGARLRSRARVGRLASAEPLFIQRQQRAGPGFDPAGRGALGCIGGTSGIRHQVALLGRVGLLYPPGDEGRTRQL